jgi:acyl dehydratase
VYASQTLKFAAPVYVGDEVVARVQVLNIRTTGATNSSTASRYMYAPAASLAHIFALLDLNLI